jgi:hypothetical protein
MSGHVVDRGPNGRWFPRCAADLQPWPCDHWEQQRRVRALADVLDHHWLHQAVDTGTAYCTCGDWSFDARAGRHPLPVMGERFAPFSLHVAEAVLAAEAS